VTPGDMKFGIVSREKRVSKTHRENLSPDIPLSPFLGPDRGEPKAAVPLTH